VIANMPAAQHGEESHVAATESRHARWLRSRFSLS
jgi:hypothetical protein